MESCLTIVYFIFDDEEHPNGNFVLFFSHADYFYKYILSIQLRLYTIDIFLSISSVIYEKDCINERVIVCVIKSTMSYFSLFV